MFRTASATPTMAPYSTLGRTATSAISIDLTGDDEEEMTARPFVATFGPRAGTSVGQEEGSGLKWEAPAPLLSPSSSRQQTWSTENSNAGGTPTPPSNPSLRGLPHLPLLHPAPIGLPPPMVARTSSLPAQGPIKQHPIIDLTSSPSPPPMEQHALPITLAPAPPCNLPPDLPAKTPVCIGQLTCTALVLYPIDYVCPHANEDAGWVPVRYLYEHNPTKPIGTRETIHIKAPDCKLPTGELQPGEKFAVFEQRVATIIGPMLGKGLIRVDAKVRKLASVTPMLTLAMLVYTPKGNIPVVGNYMREHNLLLDHPTTTIFDCSRVAQCWYHNPHNPPPGGHNRQPQAASINPSYSGPGAVASRWNTPSAPGKSVEVQRSQAEELFKSLKSGDDLPETEPAPEVSTPLYPHQKKALTFLLEREREQASSEGHSVSLWQPRLNPFTGQTSWTHLVTQREAFSEPDEAKGAILADDMGLGKTITCVSLIAATLDSAAQFVTEALPPPPPAPPRESDSSLNASHFSGSVWGMPDTSAGNSTQSTKAQAKAAREADRQEAEYVRYARLKVKSRATLIICPLSTISNWEDQIREHWRGEVTVVGGGGVYVAPAVPPKAAAPTVSGLCTMGPLTQSLLATEAKLEPEAPTLPAVPAVPPPAAATRVREGRPCRVYVYHGNARRPDPAFLADFDVVITTFSTLATEYSKQSRCATLGDECEDVPSPGSAMLEIDEQGNTVAKPTPGKKGVKRKKCMPTPAEAASALQSVMWFRVVLDEAHSIKETGTVACRACCDLFADRRLCLTGTPVQNKLDDVFALVKFLRLEPFADKSAWSEYIGNPCKFGQRIGVARLQTIMKCITLRRTKDMRSKDGEQILNLPPRRDELRYLKFDPEEQAIYDQFFQESKSEFSEMSRKNEVMKNYVGILQKILRLRQICDHYQLVEGKSLCLDDQGQCRQSYEEIVAAIAQEGITPERANAVFALIKEAGNANCVECGYELCAPTDPALAEGVMDAEGPSAPKRGRKSKASTTASRQQSPVPVRPLLTRCLHLFCAGCFRNGIFPAWPNVPVDQRRACTACQTTLAPSDSTEVNPDTPLPGTTDTITGKKKVTAKRAERRQRGLPLENYRPSTKVQALLTDLMQFSRANPNSANYDPESLELQMVDDKGNDLDSAVKTVVFSQWTTMLDKVEDALEANNIRYDRLDGTMKREERVKAMDALKYDPGCEVLLVSLRAGGVGLNLTAASRVYLMDPYWNPAVENQAVDRIHRLGQTRPVTTIKLVIENTIEDKLLGVQKRKMQLADLTLGQMSKAQNLERRMEELRELFA